MSNSDIYVEALRRLCDSSGGPVAVAQRIGRSAENLKQILKGVPLPSGNPRGVGPDLRKALTDHYPGWLSLSHKSSEADPSKRPSFRSNETQGHTRNQAIDGKKSQFEQLTNDLPVEVELSWEQLMRMILKEGLGALNDGVWVKILDDSMANEFNPGDRVRIQRFEGDTYKAGEFVLFREVGGDLLLREYRLITSTVFEAVPLNSRYGTLHSKDHGLEALARVTDLTKSYQRR